jgi:hypothetical protein
MKYEDTVKGSREVKAPHVHAERSDTMSGSASETIIGMLQAVDRKTRTSIRVLQGVYGFMIFLAIGYLIANNDGMVRAALGFITLAFILVIITQQLRYRAYSQTYLDVPMVEYLRRAKKRMRVFTVRTWLAIPTWLFIDVGICLFIYNASGKFEIPVSYIILGLQVPFAILIALDFLSEYLVWKRNHKPAVVEIDRMLGEIEASTIP